MKNPTLLLRPSGWLTMAQVMAALVAMATAVGFAQEGGGVPPGAKDRTGDAAETGGHPVDPESSPAGRDVYLGRDIAKTMHWRGAQWLLRETRENEENGKLLRKWLDVRPGDSVCDLGCGNGYHTLPLAKAVGPMGKVFAVDLQPKMLEFLDARAKEEGIESLVPIECTVDDPGLASGSVDMVLMVDVYHELTHPVRVLAHLRKALKKDGLVVLVEFRAEDRGVPIKVRHKMSKAQIIREMAANGFALVKETDRLPWQHAMAFGVQKGESITHEYEELGRGFLGAMAGDDPRIVLPYLADKVNLGNSREVSAKELAIEIGDAMQSGPPIPKGTHYFLSSMEAGVWYMHLLPEGDKAIMGDRRSIRLLKDKEGRYRVTDWN